jgi:hypothetical protein
MRRLFTASLLIILTSCVNSEYRFERIDDGQATSLPLRFDSLYGVRDGDSVKAEARFKDGQDSAQVNIEVRLGPPVQFASGSYRANIRGRGTEGPVSCDSLSFLGGQAAVPSVGGIFVLKDSAGHSLYRITMPSTPIKHGNI